MNYDSKNKIALKSIKANCIMIAVLANTAMLSYVISQNNIISENQQTIIHNQQIIIDINNAQTRSLQDILDETNTLKTKSDYIIEDISASSNAVVEETKVYEITKEKPIAKNTDTVIYNLPSGDTWFKSYMDYRTITDTSSAQYKLQQNAWTDSDGLRRQSNDYIVAMGTYYSSTVGDRFKVTLDNDKSFTVIVGDIKADIHTDETNRYRAVYDENGKFISANVLEFIVDKYEMNSRVKSLGTVSGYDYLAGNIKSIERIN